MVSEVSQHARYVYRNGHEVIRGNMRDIRAAVDADDVASAVTEWHNFAKWQLLHARMEDGDGKVKGMFRYETCQGLDV